MNPLIVYTITSLSLTDFTLTQSYRVITLLLSTYIYLLIVYPCKKRVTFYKICFFFKYVM